MSIQYSKCIVAYVDVLGFKSLLGQPDKLEVLYKKMAIVDDVSTTVPYEDFITINKLLISDGLLFWAEPKTFGDYVFFLVKVGMVQLALHMAQIFTRGSIAYGEHFYKNNILISPSFVKAYETETKDAIYPRIVFSMSALEVIKHVIDADVGSAKAREQFEQLTHLDQDGYRFLDYLKHLTVVYSEEKTGAVEASKAELEQNFAFHRGVLLKALSESKDSGHVDVTKKYVWLANYHNDFVNRLPIRINPIFCLIEDKHLELRPS